VQKESKGLLAPTGVALDFEEALAEGFVRVFPNAVVCNDFFHLMQANVKKCRQLHLQSIQPDIVNGVRELFYAASKDEFDLALIRYLKDMDNRAPAYAAYFRRTWLDRYPRERWASFARPPTAPTGTHISFLFCLLFDVTHASHQAQRPPKAITDDWMKSCPLARSLQTRWLTSWLVKTNFGSAWSMTLDSGAIRKNTTAPHKHATKKGGSPSPLTSVPTNRL
jgi:hypothetical protein